MAEIFIISKEKVTELDNLLPRRVLVTHNHKGEHLHYSYFLGDVFGEDFTLPNAFKDEYGHPLGVISKTQFNELIKDIVFDIAYFSDMIDSYGKLTFKNQNKKIARSGRLVAAQLSEILTKLLRLKYIYEIHVH